MMPASSPRRIAWYFRGRDRLQTICRVACDDGMRFDADSVQVVPIREQARYDGLRADLLGWLGNARCNVQLDVGFGDAVTPAAQEMDYPTLLVDTPAPRLRVYPRETVLAEKLEAMIVLGMRNSRMKEYFDVWMLLRQAAFDPGGAGAGDPCQLHAAQDGIARGLADRPG